jgi:hypothetical protein
MPNAHEGNQAQHQQTMVNMLVAAVANLIPGECRNLEGHHDDVVNVPGPALLPLADSTPTNKQTPHNVRIERMPASLKLLHIPAIVWSGHCELKAPAKAPLVDELADIELESECRAALSRRYAVMTPLMKKGRRAP